MLKDSRVRLGPVEAADTTDLAPGEIRAGKREVLVGTGSTAVRLGEVIAQGKRAMTAADWARGVRLDPGEAFA
jgi:methionyl-tRNA formyltransferase